MKDVFLLYDKCCVYEIAALNYFLNFSGCEEVFCSLDGKAVCTMEGYSVNVDMALAEVDKSQIRSFVIPGGNVSKVNNEEVRSLLRKLHERKVLLAAICSGVDLLDDAGILKGLKSTHSVECEVANDEDVITSRANGYVDFAIEVAKELKLFRDEKDLQETINFWKYHKRM